MNRIRSFIRKWRYRLFPNPIYVVVYDIGDHEQGEDVLEEYYGYFGSVAEARHMYEQLRGHNYYAAKICRVVERIEDR